MSLFLQTTILICSLSILMCGILKFMLRDFHRDLNHIRKNMEELKAENGRTETRIDHLYQICIDMLKTRK